MTESLLPSPCSLSPVQVPFSTRLQLLQSTSVLPRVVSTLRDGRCLWQHCGMRALGSHQVWKESQDRSFPLWGLPVLSSVQGLGLLTELPCGRALTHKVIICPVSHIDAWWYIHHL